MKSRSLILLLIIGFFLARTTAAHEGPPFPIVVDQKLDRYLVSVWTDPDVGTGLFFVIVNAPDGGSIPEDLRVQVGVQPVSGRLPEVFYSGERENLRDRTQFRAAVKFDAEEHWQVRIRLESSEGNFETLATVEVTPPGYGRWDLLLYLLPFLAVGGLWILAIIRRRSHR